MLAANGLPEKERDSVGILSHLLGALDQHHIDFASALSLFDFCETTMDKDALKEELKIDTLGWLYVAARDGAMTIHHFGTTLQNIREGLGFCPTIKAWAETGALRISAKKFDSLFPGFPDLRHALAHSADIMKTTERFEKHAFRGNFKGIGIDGEESQILLSSHLHYRKFSLSYEGQIISYNINSETAERLNTAKTEFFDAFRPAEINCRKAAREAAKERSEDDGQ